MRPGWYIVNYHDVDYEDSVLTRALGSTTRPDVFAEHLAQMARMGRFVAIDEGVRLLEEDRIREPLFSVWFDDGFTGACDEAVELCRRYGARGAMSICSRFVMRQQMFWRAQLSYLAQVDGLRLLRSRLRKVHGQVPMRLRRWTLDNFSEDLVATIDGLYQELSHEAFRKDAFRIFADERRIARLDVAGWTLANHGAAHYPVIDRIAAAQVLDQFEECRALVTAFGVEDRYWVLPFGIGTRDHLRRMGERAIVVEVGDRANTPSRWRRTRRLYRFQAPEVRNLRLG